MEAPRAVRPDEFAELMAFIDMVFRPGQKGRCIMQGQYPHLFQHQPAFCTRYLIVRDRGEIVGHLAIHPLTVRLEEVVLQAGGIGQVGTHPAYRGQGIMTMLLNAAVERMAGQRYPISILGGDRQRYGWFGWENGGVRNCFILTRRQLGKPSPAERRLPLERLMVTPKVGRQLQTIDRQRAYRVERPSAELKPLFERRSRDVWGCREGERFAYVALGGANHQARPYERVDEAGGDPELVLSMIRLLMARYRRERLLAICGSNQGDVAPLLGVSAAWERHTDGMLKIIDLPVLLEALKPLLQRRAKALGAGGCFDFVMEDTGQHGTLELGQGPPQRVRLSGRELISLFFGVLPVREVFAEESIVGCLDKILPLPFYIPPLNHI